MGPLFALIPLLLAAIPAQAVTCGTTQCAAGECCSAYGYCRTSAWHCNVALGCAGGCTSNTTVSDANGPCGPANNGLTCAAGLCCSAAGYCGSTAAYCGVGCLFGACLSSTPPASPPPAIPPPASPPPVISPPPASRVTCGTTQCAVGECCSAYGYCGSSPWHCNVALGCAGGCTSNTTVSGANGPCGPSNNGLTCAAGLCCSGGGYCGSTNAYCGAGCLSGACGSPAPPPPAPTPSPPPPAPSPPPPTPSPPPSTGTAGDGDSCKAGGTGPDGCGPGLCCSKYGFCGNSIWHCAQSLGCIGSCAPTCAQPALPATPPPSAVPFGWEVNYCKDKGVFALTFDDGPSWATRSVLDVLEKYKVKATFFVQGNKLFSLQNGTNNYASSTLEAYQLGHQIAAHSWDHESNLSLSAKERTAELDITNCMINQVIGKIPQWYRAPYGETDTNFLQSLKTRQVKISYWSYSAEDWLLWQNGKTTQDLIDTYADWLSRLNGSSPTALPPVISLNHDRFDTTMEAIETIIQMVLAKGYKIQPVGTCTHDPEDKWYF